MRFAVSWPFEAKSEFCGVMNQIICAPLLPVSLFLCASLSHASDWQKAKLLVSWNAAALHATYGQKPGALIQVRALAIVHTCMYDAWAAYDEHAAGTQLAGALRRPASERTQANKQKAISYAAYRALTDTLGYYLDHGQHDSIQSPSQPPQ